jgi:ankyrin repeat protein
MKTKLFYSVLLAGALLLITTVSQADEATQSTAAVQPTNPKAVKALFDAAKKGDLESLKLAVSQGANINAQDKAGQTALMLAAREGKTDLVRFLLDNGADVNLQDKNGASALHLATQIGMPKPKKSGFGGFGKMLGGMAGGLIGSGLGGGALNGLSGPVAQQLLGAIPLDSMLGQNLKGLISGNGFNLSSKNGWSAIVGTALQGDSKLGGSLGLATLLSGDLKKMDASGWTNLLSGVQGANPQVLTAMSNLAEGGNGKSELWNQFITKARNGDQKGVTDLLNNPEFAPLLEQATNGLSSASSDLPGNVSKNIVNALVAKGAKTNLADLQGQTPSQLAKARGLEEIQRLLATQ